MDWWGSLDSDLIEDLQLEGNKIGRKRNLSERLIKEGAKQSTQRFETLLKGSSRHMFLVLLNNRQCTTAANTARSRFKG